MKIEAFGCKTQMFRRQQVDMSQRAYVLVCLLFLSTLSTTLAVPEEDQNFQPSHSGSDFPVGYVELIQIQMHSNQITVLYILH